MKNEQLKSIGPSEVDLFKCDIYSLGITYIEAVTDLNIKGLNSNPGSIDKCAAALEQTDLPI